MLYITLLVVLMGFATGSTAVYTYSKN